MGEPSFSTLSEKKDPRRLIDSSMSLDRDRTGSLHGTINDFEGRIYLLVVLLGYSMDPGKIGLG